MGPRRRVSMGATADGGGADTTPGELIQRLQRKLQPLEIVNYLPNMILYSQLKSHDSVQNSIHIDLFTIFVNDDVRRPGMLGLEYTPSFS